MKGIGVFIPPPGYNVSPSQATSPSVPPNTTYHYNVGYLTVHWYQFILLSEERHCEVKFLSQEHNTRT